MTDAMAAVVDERLRPPRQGDGDDGTALLLDDPAYDRWAALLSTGAALFGSLPWWPALPERDVRTTLWTACAPAASRPRVPVSERSQRRPGAFADAGMVILRSESDPHATSHGNGVTLPEIWCRCDHGPLGYLSVAAHGHADALAIELRHGGVDVLADPGTYCYHGEHEWRGYFRSTIAHNTLEIGGESQSADGGPFLWLQPVPTRLIALEGLDGSSVAAWEAEHLGYSRLTPPAVHRRRVELDRDARTLTVVDRVACDGEHQCRLAFHVGTSVEAVLGTNVACLRWELPTGGVATAEMRLPSELVWNAVRGGLHPPLGWYSPAFDEKRPTTALIGTGRLGRGREVRSVVRFDC
jgi:hypothetical protein